MTEDRHKEVSDGHPENAISAYGTARSTVQGAPLSSEELREIEVSVPEPAKFEALIFKR